MAFAAVGQSTVIAGPLHGSRATGIAFPFIGQPVQGFSGIKSMKDGSFWVLTDNGFGSKINSTDAMLMLHHLTFDWDAGAVKVEKTLFLTDPDKKAPFPIVMEGSDKRYLTGADFDVESIQPVADGFWVGEELGPYMLKFSSEGVLTDVMATKAGITKKTNLGDYWTKHHCAAHHIEKRSEILTPYNIVTALRASIARTPITYTSRTA